jgi:tetratricopeptide (TPR) repeat protein
MYGGMDRSAYPDLKAGDEKLVKEASEQFGGLRNASMAFVDQGFSLYQQNDNENAMRRFNQAWLLNPDNSEVYWGFSVIAHDKGEYCEAIDLLETGIDKGGLQKGYMPDLAVLYAACAMHNTEFGEEERAKYNEISEEIFRASEGEPEVSKPYLYFQMARSNNARGRYAEAWAAVRLYRASTDIPFDERLLDQLRKNMPEPE